MDGAKGTPRFISFDLAVSQLLEQRSLSQIMSQDISQGILARFQLELCKVWSVVQRCVTPVDKCLAAYVARYSCAAHAGLALFILHVSQVIQIKT